MSDIVCKYCNSEDAIKHDKYKDTRYTSSITSWSR